MGGQPLIPTPHPHPSSPTPHSLPPTPGPYPSPVPSTPTPQPLPLNPYSATPTPCTLHRVVHPVISTVDSQRQILSRHMYPSMFTADRSGIGTKIAGGVTVMSCQVCLQPYGCVLGYLLWFMRECVPGLLLMKCPPSPSSRWITSRGLVEAVFNSASHKRSPPCFLWQ